MHEKDLVYCPGSTKGQRAWQGFCLQDLLKNFEIVLTWPTSSINSFPHLWHLAPLPNSPPRQCSVSDLNRDPVI